MIGSLHTKRKLRNLLSGKNRKQFIGSQDNDRSKNINIPATKVPKFRPGKQLREKMK